MNIYQLLQEKVKPFNLKIETNIPLGKYSTLGVGGKASFLVETHDSFQLETILRTVNYRKIPYKLLGKGSNIIFSDDGFDGLVIVNNSTKWHILNHPAPSCRFKSDESRFQQLSKNKIVEDILAHDEQNDPYITVRVDSGVQIQYLMNALYKKEVTGLQWYSGIPATVGGAIYMNMHGANHYFSEIVHSARLISPSNEIKHVGNDYFRFEYDRTILHQTKETILWADLCLKKGDVNKAREIGKKWAVNKSFQPQRSAGCIFQNLTPEQQKEFNLPSPSAGYLIDRVLKLKGARLGDAVISEKHAAFIENLGNAKASDIVGLIKMIRDKAYKEFGIELQLEVELIGKFHKWFS